MIFEKFWSALRAQFNKLANVFWEADPIAQMQYEYDRAVDELKGGRKGLETYRGLVEKVARQVRTNEVQVKKLEAQAKAYLKAGDRETAGRFALELQRAKQQLADNREQLEVHEGAYDNNLTKIKHANKKLAEVRERIKRYDAELEMSEAEAEIAELSKSFDMNVTTDFGQLETMIQEKIDHNRGRARVSADLSERGIADIEAEERMESAMASDALREMEIEMGLVTPETSPLVETDKALGPAVVELETQTS